MNLIRIPNLQKSISAKLSTSRFLKQTLGFGKGMVPDLKKKRYNKKYRQKVKTLSEMSQMSSGSFSGLKSQRIADIQEKLKEKGFYSGEIDGVLDIKTQEAIKKLQKKNNIAETGELDFQTMAVVNK